MKASRNSLIVAAVMAAFWLQGCSNSAKFPDVTAGLRNGLKQAGLRDVSVDQDRDKGVVTLKGDVPTDADKANANNIAHSLAGGEVVANEIAVQPPGQQSAARKIDADLDGGIEKNLDAALIAHGMHSDVSYTVHQGVVTLSGNVTSENARSDAQQLAANVPNVQQVVNKLQVKDQKATSTN